MNVTITVFMDGGGSRAVELAAEKGALLSAVLRSEGLLDLPCGVGRCGKCLVYADTPPTDEDAERLSPQALASGLRLACHTPVVEGLTCTLPKKNTLSVLTSFAQTEYPFVPLVSHGQVPLVPPSLDDQRPDIERLMTAGQTSRHALTLAQMAGLASFMRENAQGYIVHQNDELLGYSPHPEHLAFIVDIGTTTVAALLVDLKTQRILAATGEKNAQAPFGADVISRIRCSLEDGAEPLQRVIVSQLNALLQRLLGETGFAAVNCIALTGNCTMLHLLCGFPAEHISRAPFIPLSTEALRVHAAHLGLTSQAPVFLLPGISAYIGADIVAALLAVDAHHARKPFLLVDFGTNAETVLFTGDTFYACSAAAGPCFEGAALSCGMAGQQGAVDTVFATPTGFSYTVIGGARPVGLCGSGVIDAVSLLLETGYMDASGRLLPEGSGTHPGLRDHFTEGKEFRIAPGVSLNQKDIREIQLAKAAVRAGIEVLLQESGVAAHDLQTLYLAGGFGSCMTPESAARIGLIPGILTDKVRVMGNAACFGALRYVTEKDAIASAGGIIARTAYIELSSHTFFSKEYISRMGFPG